MALLLGPLAWLSQKEIALLEHLCFDGRVLLTFS